MPNALAVLIALLAAAQAETEYPADITPPPGTSYPCALTPLPRSLPGIPEADRRYINRAYALILRATQAKLVVLKALEERSALESAHSRYESRVRSLEELLRTETVPPGLEAFQEDVASALTLQRAFFAKATPIRDRGGSMAEVYQVPEGRQASQRLIAAWTRMQQRYPGWTKETADSIFHHLCALDLF